MKTAYASMFLLTDTPLAYPQFAKQTALLYKPYLYASAEMTFTLFYREECEKFYPTIADFFSSI